MRYQMCSDCGKKCRATLNICPTCYPTKGPTRFEQAFRDMPVCVDLDPLAMKTMDDLRHAARIQLDLIEERQDGTEDDDPKAIKRWLKKYSRPQKKEK
jgi:hypothetical protein